MTREASSAVWLDDHLHVWKHLIHMLSSDEPVIRRLDAGQSNLRPPLELAPEEGAVALPERIDWFPDAEHNRDAYRFLTLQLAGRREWGTYAEGHAARLHHRHGERASPLAELFALTEGVRIQSRLGAAYPGCARDARQLAAAWLAQRAQESEPTLASVCDSLLALALAPPEARILPPWLPAGLAENVLAQLAMLERADATASRSFELAATLLRQLAAPVLQRVGTDAADTAERKTGSISALEAVDVFDLASDDAEAERAIALSELGALDGDAADSGDDGSSHASAAPSGEVGRAIAGRADSAQNHDDERSAAFAARRSRPRPTAVQTFVYDEWDYTTSAYLPRRCRVHELAMPADAGAFFDHTLHSARPLLAEVRRQFERIRPARYRPLRGLPDGEDFDLNALTDARIEARARRTPSPNIYTQRTRQLRDVATLFLVDVSASTDQPYVEPGEPPARRIIDTIKEALVIMSMALQDLGDSYAIYAFSSQGPDRVEMYPIKAFDEALSNTVRARVGGMEPKHGTRMGPALRHAITKLARSHARSRHLILLSDGFPQDHEYGPDRRTHTYGIEDTAVALREVRAAGATPFCITVDRAGHDYLRRMCDPSQYLVIDDVDALPRELPKIYRTVVRDG